MTTTSILEDPEAAVPARLAALKTAPTPELKALWRKLNDSEPPPFNRRYLESRLAYRIQELVFGGLKPETVRRLERLGEDLDGGDRKKRRMRTDQRPIETAGVQSASGRTETRNPLQRTDVLIASPAATPDHHSALTGRKSSCSPARRIASKMTEDDALSCS